MAKAQYPVSEFRYGQFACYLVSLGRLLGCRHAGLGSRVLLPFFNVEK